MSVYLGIDVGTVSVKVALVADGASSQTLLDAAGVDGLFRRPPQRLETDRDPSSSFLVAPYHRIKGSPVHGTGQILDRIMAVIPPSEMGGARVCGSRPPAELTEPLPL